MICVYMYVCNYVSLSVCLFFCLFVCVCLSVCLCLLVCVCLFVCLIAWLFVCVFVRLPFTCVCVFVWLLIIMYECMFVSFDTLWWYCRLCTHALTHLPTSRFHNCVCIYSLFSIVEPLYTADGVKSALICGQYSMPSLNPPENHEPIAFWTLHCKMCVWCAGTIRSCWF